MIRISTALVLGAAMAVASCATSYGPNFLTGGYSDEKLDTSHFRVKFNGNGYASQERVWNFWIYRCAELTKQQGYTHFALQRPGQPLSVGPQQPEFKRAAYRDDESPRMLKTKGGASYVPMYIPGARITTWHTDAVVSMYSEPLPENLLVLKAQVVLDELAPYIKSNGNTTPTARDDLFRRAAAMNRPESNYNFGGDL